MSWVTIVLNTPTVDAAFIDRRRSAQLKTNIQTVVSNTFYRKKDHDASLTDWKLRKNERRPYCGTSKNIAEWREERLTRGFFLVISDTVCVYFIWADNRWLNSIYVSQVVLSSSLVVLWRLTEKNCTTYWFSRWTASVATHGGSSLIFFNLVHTSEKSSQCRSPPPKECDM